jgi:hypothetical protein
MIAQFWWSHMDKTNKIHWVSWEKLSKTKSIGGLGFRDLHAFNLAMLAKQAWRLLQNPSSLCAQVLAAKYFPNNSMLQATPQPGISYASRSILKGIQLLKDGIIWRVGDGDTIKIWTDPWIPRGSTRKLISQVSKVSELINQTTNTWDTNLVQQTFAPEDVELILQIPIYEHTSALLHGIMIKKKENLFLD